MSCFASHVTDYAQGEETEFLTLKVCRLCTLTKPIPERDHACEDCWALRMAGRAMVTCPFYLFEAVSSDVPDARVPIEICYDCAHREGWTPELGPVCSHPVAVPLGELWGVEVVECPKASAQAGESRRVPAGRCRGCPHFKGELVNLEGRFTYCAFPRHNRVCQEAGETCPASFESSLDGTSN